ncbi:TPA: pathogenicity island protein [Staphylococcus aureus]|nr:pathogenicity island protein [Staphylococcus aureus]
MQSIAEKETHHLPTEHLQVFNVIKNTSNKYITKTKILNQLGYEVNKANNRWLTQVITSLIINYHYPIGYSYKKDTRGYYIIKTQADKIEAIKSIKGLIEGSQNRLKALEEIEV